MILLEMLPASSTNGSFSGEIQVIVDAIRDEIRNSMAKIGKQIFIQSVQPIHTNIPSISDPDSTHSNESFDLNRENTSAIPKTVQFETLNRAGKEGKEPLFE
jgi:hypothetical protein